MASRNDRPYVPVGRKIWRLGIGVAVVIALYTVGWFYGASRLETFLKGQMAGNNGGYVAQCDDLAVGGYPFLIGVTCARTRLDQPANDLTMETGAFRSAARVYMPGNAMAELDAPFRAKLGDMVGVEGDWSSMRASMAAGLDGLQRASFEGKDVDLTITLPIDFTAFKIDVGEPQLHVRNNQGDLDVAVMATDLAWQQLGYDPQMPPMSASADVTLVGKGAVLEGKPWGSKAAKGELRALKVDLGGGVYGELSGPFAIDEDGWMSGTLDMTLERLDLWDKTLGKAFPDAAGTISGISQLIKTLSKGKTDRVTVKLAIIKGTITLSMLPIGHIPQF